MTWRHQSRWIKAIKIRAKAHCKTTNLSSYNLIHKRLTWSYIKLKRQLAQTKQPPPPSELEANTNNARGIYATQVRPFQSAVTQTWRLSDLSYSISPNPMCVVVEVCFCLNAPVPIRSHYFRLHFGGISEVEYAMIGLACRSTWDTGAGKMGWTHCFTHVGWWINGFVLHLWE